MITRLTRSFSTPVCMIRLFCTHVRSRLEFGSVVWNVLSATDCSRIEAVQKSLFVCCTTGIADVDVSTSTANFLKKIYLECLSTRSDKRDLMFLNKLVSGNIDCAYLLMNLFFHVPQRFRRHFLLFCPANHTKLRPLTRMPLAYNDLPLPCVDITMHSHILFARHSLNTFADTKRSL